MVARPSATTASACLHQRRSTKFQARQTWRSQGIGDLRLRIDGIRFDVPATTSAIEIAIASSAGRTSQAVRRTATRHDKSARSRASFLNLATIRKLPPGLSGVPVRDHAADSYFRIHEFACRPNAGQASSLAMISAIFRSTAPTRRLSSRQTLCLGIRRARYGPASSGHPTAAMLWESIPYQSRPEVRFFYGNIELHLARNGTERWPATYRRPNICDAQRPDQRCGIGGNIVAGVAWNALLCRAG